MSSEPETTLRVMVQQPPLKPQEVFPRLEGPALYAHMYNAYTYSYQTLGLGLIWAWAPRVQIPSSAPQFSQVTRFHLTRNPFASGAKRSTKCSQPMHPCSCCPDHPLWVKHPNYLLYNLQQAFSNYTFSHKPLEINTFIKYKITNEWK